MNLYERTLVVDLPRGGHVRAIRNAAPHPRVECVLLHGNPGSLLDFAPLMSELDPYVGLLALDLPGFGRSPRPLRGREGLSLDALADDVIATIDSLELSGPIAVIGHSHGGAVAQRIAARHPERISKIVCIGSLGSPAQPTYRLLAAPGMPALARAAALLFAQRALSPLADLVLRAAMRDIFHPERADAARRRRELEFLRQHSHVLTSMVDVATTDPCSLLRRSAAEIRCPALFIHGERDVLVPPAHARAIHHAIVANGGESEFRLIPRAGHMLITYQSREVAREILQFLESPPDTMTRPRA